MYAIRSYYAFLIYFLVRFAYVKIKFGFQPFEKKHFVILAFGAAAYFISILIPQLGGVITDTVIRTALLGVLFSVPVYLSGYSGELNIMVNKVVKIVKRQS